MAWRTWSVDFRLHMRMEVYGSGRFACVAPCRSQPCCDRRLSSACLARHILGAACSSASLSWPAGPGSCWVAASPETRGAELASLLRCACSPLLEAGETSSINKPPVRGSAADSYLPALVEFTFLACKECGASTPASLPRWTVLSSRGDGGYERACEQQSVSGNDSSYS